MKQTFLHRLKTKPKVQPKPVDRTYAECNADYQSYIGKLGEARYVLARQEAFIQHILQKVFSLEEEGQAAKEREAKISVNTEEVK